MREMPVFQEKAAKDEKRVQDERAATAMRTEQCSRDAVVDFLANLDNAVCNRLGTCTVLIRLSTGLKGSGCSFMDIQTLLRREKVAVNVSRVSNGQVEFLFAADKN